MLPGQQLVQSIHALADFAHLHPIPFDRWKKSSNTLVSLAEKSTTSLTELFLRLESKGFVVVPFYEPNLDNQLTALAVYGDQRAQKYLRFLPLALKQREEVQNVA